MSEDKSADSPSTIESLGEPATTSIPRQSFGEAPAADSSGESVEQAFGGAAEPAPTPAAPVATPEPAPVVQSLGSSAGDEPSPSAALTSVVPPPKKKNNGVLIASVIAVVVVIVIAVVGFLLYQRIYVDPTKNAAAGDCLTDLPVVGPGEDREAKGAKIVDCGDAAGAYRVEGRLNGQTPEQAKNADVCKAYPDATFIYRAVPESGGTGYVLCLKKLA